MPTHVGVGLITLARRRLQIRTSVRSDPNVAQIMTMPVCQSTRLHVDHKLLGVAKRWLQITITRNPAPTPINNDSNAIAATCACRPTLLREPARAIRALRRAA
jgi:hypothetical protein